MTRFLKTRTSVAASLLAFAPSLAMGDESPAPESGDSNGSVAGESSRPEDVRVRARAAPRSASETTREQEVLQAAPHRTGSDLLSVMPGVTVTQHSGEGKAHQIFMRGFDAVHGQDVELTVAGIPVNDVSNIHGQGYADLHFMPVELVSEIRSQPGMYDPGQGDFAIAGSLAFALGLREPGFLAKASYGSFGTSRLFVADRPREASKDTFIAFEEAKTEGFGPNRFARRGSLLGQTTLDIGSSTALRLFASTYAGRFDSAGVLRARDIETGLVDRFSTYDSKQGGSSSRTQLGVTLTHKQGSERFTVMPFVVARDMTLRQNFTGYVADDLGSGKTLGGSDNTQQIHHDWVLGVRAAYERPLQIFREDDSLTLGVYGRHDRIAQSQRRLSANTDEPTSTLVDADVFGTNVATYVDVKMHPLSRLVVRGGARIDVLHFEVQDKSASGAPQASRSSQGSNIGKKVSLDYALLPGWHALASYGEGFRSPQARSLSNGEKTIFSTVRGVEVGSRFQISTAFGGSLAGFYNQLSDDLLFDQVTARNERVAGTRRVGGAADLMVKSHGLLVAASLTYTRSTFVESDARVTSSALLPYVPQIVSRLDTTYSRNLAHIGKRSLEGRAGAAFQGIFRRPLPYDEFGRDIFLVDLTAGLRLAEVELGLDIQNALGLAYYDGQFVYASSFDRGASPRRVPELHVTAGQPRTFFAHLSLHL